MEKGSFGDLAGDKEITDIHPPGIKVSKPGSNSIHPMAMDVYEKEHQFAKDDEIHVSLTQQKAQMETRPKECETLTKSQLISSVAENISKPTEASLGAPPSFVKVNRPPNVMKSHVLSKGTKFTEKRESVLPSMLLDKVTSIVKEQTACKVGLNTSDRSTESEETKSVVNKDGAIGQDDNTLSCDVIQEDSTYMPPQNNGSFTGVESSTTPHGLHLNPPAKGCDTIPDTMNRMKLNSIIEDDIYDVSCLFSETFEKSFKEHKRKERKAKKRKVNDKHIADNGKKKKTVIQRPNYFVAIPITNAQIPNWVAEVQSHMLDHQPLLSASFVSPKTLHLTMFVLYIANEEDMERARRALADCEGMLQKYRDAAFSVCVSGIGDFRQNVIFAKLIPGKNIEKLQDVARVVEHCFSKHGFTESGRSFEPHITMMKLSKAPKLRKKGIKKINPSVYEKYKDQIFGIQTIRFLQLCSMLKPKDELGYYHVEDRLKLVEDCYKEPSIEVFHEQNGSTEESKRQQEENITRKSQQLARQILRDALLELNKENPHVDIETLLSELENSQPIVEQNRDDMSTNREPKLFIAQLERRLSWTFQMGDVPNLNDVVSALKEESKYSSKRTVADPKSNHVDEDKTLK